MSGLKWHIANLPNPDPARYDPSPYHAMAESGSMTDGELTALRRKNALKGKRKIASKLATARRRTLKQVLAGKPPESLANLGKRIAVIRSSGSTDSDHFIHETAILVLIHAKKHGDCSAALDLVAAMPSGRRQAKLAEWFATYGPIQVMASRGTVRLTPKNSTQYRAFDLEAARSRPFYTE